MLRFRVPALGLSRTAALSRLEAATMRFALARAERRTPDASDRALVEEALKRLDASEIVTTATPPEIRAD